MVVVPLDAPDSRKIQLIVREGEQHDLIQFVADYFELYKIPTASVEMVANEVHKRYIKGRDSSSISFQC